MNSPKKQLENLKEKINNLQHDQEKKSEPKRNSGAGFGFKISTENSCCPHRRCGYWFACG